MRYALGVGRARGAKSASFVSGSASVWATDGNPFHFGVEIAKANMNREKKPDLGKKVDLTFHPV